MLITAWEKHIWNDLALKNYEPTLKLDPQNKNAGEMIKKIRLKH